MIGIVRFLVACMLFLLCSSIAVGQWESVGGLEGRYFTSVATLHGRIYAASNFSNWSNLSMSADRGNTWRTSPLLVGNGSHKFCSIPAVSDTTIVVTSAIGTTVLYRSTDFGARWTPSDSGLGQQQISALAYSRGGAQGGCLIASIINAGAYISTNAGRSWAPSGSAVPSLPCNTVAATDSFLFAGTTGSGVVRSADHGATWVRHNSGLADTTVSVLSAFDGVIYAACDSTVYRSTDNGAHWLPVGPGKVPATVANITVLHATSASPSVFAYGSAGMFRWRSGDTSWTKIREEGIPPYDIFSSGLAAIDSTLITISPFVLSISSDLGNTWEPVHGASNATSLWRDPSGGLTPWSDMYTAADSSLFRSTDKGRTWTKVLTTGERGSIVSLSTPEAASLPASHLLLAGSNPGYMGMATVHRSIDGGATWKQIFSLYGRPFLSVTGVDSLVVAAAITGMLQAVPGDTLSGVYFSSNAGDSWIRTQWGAPSDSGITDVALFAGTNGHTLLFSGSYDLLFRSTDLGATWSSSMTGVTGHGRKWIRKVGSDLFLANSGKITVTFDENGDGYPNYDSARVFRSKDEGVTWQDVTGSLHAPFIRGFDAFRSASSGLDVRLAAVSDDSVFACVDAPGLWQNVTYGSTRDLQNQRGSIVADADHFYLGVIALRRLAWASIPRLTDVGHTPMLPAAFSLDQNYPNPFNPSTTIRFTLPSAAHVNIVMFDILGREVAVLLDARSEAGLHELRFDGAGLSSGAYFCRVHVDGVVQTRKLMLCR